MAEDSKGELDSFIEGFREAYSAGRFVRAVLGKYRGELDLSRIDIRAIKLKDGPMLSFTYHHKTKDIVKNYQIELALKELKQLAGRDFLSATLFSTDADLYLEFSRKRVARLKKGKPTYRSADQGPHNRSKEYLIDSKSKFLSVLGISRGAEILPSWQDKFRQINKFVEIVDALLPKGLEGEIKAVDFGSGKHYLTFALYHYLRELRNLEAKIVGIERRPDLVKFGVDAANLAGFSGLEFVDGEISSYPISSPDMIVALHACDTATDDAIVQGIKARAKYIVVAPCCHKFVRRGISVPKSLYPVFKHGILEENLSVCLTDGLRSLILEAFGFETKVFEFIEPEHTSKNIMITAVRKRALAEPDPAIISDFNRIKSEFGLKSIYLDQSLGLL